SSRGLGLRLFRKCKVRTFQTERSPCRPPQQQRMEIARSEYSARHSPVCISQSLRYPCLSRYASSSSGTSTSSPNFAATIARMAATKGDGPCCIGGSQYAAHFSTKFDGALNTSISYLSISGPPMLQLVDGSHG